MRALRLVASGVLLGTASFLGLAAPSYAADETQISHVEPEGDGVRILVSVPEGASPDLDEVAVTVNGESATATAELAGESADKVQRTTVLALDTSLSMRGPRFSAAIAAAERFLEVAPADIRVGIVTFNRAVETVLEPTTDRAAAQAAIDGLTLAVGTRVYDSVISAVDLSGDEGQRSVLLLSDGANTNKTPLADVETALEGSGVRLDAVALVQAPGVLANLERITTAASGALISAEPGALADAFAAEADSLARQVLVTAKVPSAVSGSEATLEVTLPSGEETLVASAYSRIRQAGYAPPPSIVRSDDASGPRVPQAALYAGLVALCLGLAILLGGLMSVLARDRGPVTVEDRIAAFGTQASTTAPTLSTASAQSTIESAKDAAASMLQRNRGLEARIEARLEAAASPLKAAEWLLLHGAIVILAGLVGFVLGGGGLLLLGLGLGAVLPWFWLGYKRKRRVAAFNGALADTLQLIAGSLQAGMSLAQSLDSVVNEGREPIAGEFKRVLIETRLGVPLETALEGIAKRIQSEDFAWVVMAIRIQREVGGNLAELLTTVAATLREREYLRRQVHSLSAEGRLSAYILIALPIGMFFYMFFLRNEYIRPLYTEFLGILMLGAALVLLSIGWFAMSRIVKVEV